MTHIQFGRVRKHFRYSRNKSMELAQTGVTISLVIIEMDHCQKVSIGRLCVVKRHRTGRFPCQLTSGPSRSSAALLRDFDGSKRDRFFETSPPPEGSRTIRTPVCADEFKAGPDSSAGQDRKSSAVPSARSVIALA